MLGLAGQAHLPLYRGYTAERRSDETLWSVL